MLSAREKIEIFDLSADIFQYPDENWLKKLELIKSMVEGKFALTIPTQNLDEIRQIYINYFDLNSKKLNIVPVASFWMDSRLMTTLSREIEKFYNMCGFEDNSFGVPDHISKMLSFCAILLEENKTSEFVKFREWLSWLDKFSASLKEVMPVACFAEISQICYLLLRENEV